MGRTMPYKDSPTAAAIRTLLCDYKEHPLRHLREVNLQAQLWYLLLDELERRGEATDTQATVSRDGFGMHRAVRSEHRVARIQMEMKIRQAAGEMTDLVLLTDSTEGVHLERRGNGTLDVIAAISPADIAAAVEIKAAGSPSLEQRHLFRMEVLKLDRFLRAAPVEQPREAHFVLVDKALPVGMHSLDFGKHPVLNWESNAPGGTWVRGAKFQGSPQLVLREPRGDERLVHVWDLDAELNVRHRVCETPIFVPDEARANELGLVRKGPKAAPG